MMYYYYEKNRDFSNVCCIVSKDMKIIPCPGTTRKETIKLDF